MKINNNYNYKSNPTSPAFKHKIFIDIGASSPNGSCKVRVTTDEGQDIFENKGYLSKDGFKSPEDFKDKLLSKIKEVHNKTINIISDNKGDYKRNEEKLTDVVVFVPGTTRDNEVSFMPNLRDSNGESIEHVDLKEYQTYLKAKNTKETGLNINKNDFEFTITKDLGGAGLGIAQILAQRGELQEGDYVVGIMPGGGFGSVDIKVKEGIVELETSESSSDIIPQLSKRKANKLGRCGAAVKSHITNYLDYLGMEDLNPMLIQLGDARIVTLNELHVKRDNQFAIDELKKDSRFNVADNSKSHEIIFKLDDSDPELKAIMEKGRTDSIKDFVNTIAVFSITKINDCANEVILVGPFVHGLNRYVKDNPEKFATKRISEQQIEENGLTILIDKKIDKIIDSQKISSTGRLKKMYDFKVICDDEINFPNNTYAGFAMGENELQFVKNRGSWFSIPLANLEKTPISS